MSKKKKNQLSPLNKITSAPRILLTFIKEAKEELKKVTWPTRQTTTRYTVIVVIASLAVGLIIGGMDYVFQLGLELII